MGNTTSAQDKSVELLKFTKWGKIEPELRSHAMSYFNGQTLYDYAQCSKLCNEEIKKFVSVPKSLTVQCLEMENKEISVFVTMSNRTSEQHFKFIDLENHQYVVNIWYDWINGAKNPTPNETSTFYGRAIEGVIGCLEQIYRNKRTRMETSEIELKFQVWPVELTNLFQKAKTLSFPMEHFKWHIQMDSSIYDSFMEIMKDGPKNMKLDIFCRDGFTLPREFYQTKLFKCIDIFKSTADNISNEEFLESNASNLTIRDTNITNVVLNQKLKKWYMDTTNTLKYFYISNDRKTRRTDVIFERLPAKETSKGTYFIRKSNRKCARIRFHDDQVDFYFYNFEN